VSVSAHIKNSDRKDITGNVMRTQTHGKKFSDRGASRQRWRAETGGEEGGKVVEE